MTARTWIVAAALAASAAPAAADGGVTAEVDPTTDELRITGDAASNDIEITWDGTPGGYTVTGKNGTTVNLLPSVAFSGARGIFVDCGAGDDRLVVTDTRIRGSLRVRGGDGDDTVVLDGAKVRGRTAIRGGLGADRVTTSGLCVFNSTFLVRTEEGDDTVDANDSEFRNRVRIDAGAGNDTIDFTNCDCEGLARFEIEGRTGADTLQVTGCSFDNDVAVDMGRDDDHVILDDSDFHQDVDLSGGGGHDDLSIRSGVYFRHPPGFHAFEE